MCKKSFFASLVAISTAFCHCEAGAERNFPYQLSGYRVDLTHVSPDGIRFDPSGQSIDVLALDRQAREMEDCLARNFGDRQGRLEMSSVGWCGYGPPMDLPFDRSRIAVKIPDDWVYSCDGSQQLLKDRAPAEGCLDKGLKPNEECPCRWRVGIQDSSVIVVTPSLYMFKDGLIRMVTGCLTSWLDPKLAECAKPTVPKLP